MSNVSKQPDLSALPRIRSLGEKYRIEGELGSGGMAHVVAARNTDLDLPVAVKFLRTEHHTPELIGRFAREARAMARLRSEYTTRILDVGTSEEVGPYIVMERLEGEDLAMLLDREGAVAIETAVDFAMMMLVALSEAHANGIIHRDIKPENVYLHDPDRNGAIVKLLDFGVSKVALTGTTFGTSVDLVKTSALVGSPLYMAPEQIRASEEIDGRTDLWAVGAVLYEMLTGRPPFNGASITELSARVIEEEPPPVSTYVPSAPVELDQAVAKCLAKNVDARWQSANDLAAALAPFSSGRVPLPVPQSERVFPASSGALYGAAGPSQSGIAPRAGARSLASGRISGGGARIGSGSLRPTGSSHAPPPKRNALPTAGIALALLASVGLLGFIVVRRGATIEPTSRAAEPPHVQAVQGAGVPAASPTTRFVSLKSNPSGANVSVDGSPNGVTPVTLNLAAGPHQILISAPGRETQTVLVQVPDNGELAPIPVVDLAVVDANAKTAFDPKRPWLKAATPGPIRVGPARSATASPLAAPPSITAAPPPTPSTTPVVAPAAPAKTVKVIDDKDRSNVRVIE